MKKKLIFALSFLACIPVAQSSAQETSLWYDAPASEWMKSMPIGNGRVGAMVFGGVDEETVGTASAPFGGGMGRLGEVCGAVSGMLMTLSFLRRPNTLDPREKAALYAEERALAEEFRAAADSILCRDLLLMRAGRKEGRGLACPDLVALAVGILEEHENARSNK